MRIATWNVNGIRARGEQVREWIERETPEVLCLQEIKASPAQVPEPLTTLADYWSFWHGFKGYSGVGLLVRKDQTPDCPVFRHPPFDMENRIVTAVVGEVTVASVYVPNGGKDFAAKMRFLTALEEYAVSFQETGDPLVIAGDLNIARAEIDVHPKERRAVIGQLPEERALFERILSRGFADVGRSLDPHNEAMYTWWAPWREMKQRNIGWRLDYFLAGEALGARATACTVERLVGTSDHAPVVATFQL